MKRGVLRNALALKGRDFCIECATDEESKINLQLVGCLNNEKYAGKRVTLS